MAIKNHKNDIHRDTNVLGANVYFDNGQGCGILWFNTIEQARSFIAKHGRISGHNSGLCKSCRHSYSFGTKEYKKYSASACKEWKKKITRIKQ